MTEIFVCTSNAGKMREFRMAAEGVARMEPLPDLRSIAPPEETGSTFAENAALKAVYYSQFTSAIVLADDSGLEVDALGGAPGVHSARYAGPQAADAENNALLLRNMDGKHNRIARFVCAIALAKAGKVLTTVRGEVEGTLLHGPRGGHGFGYDPLFFYEPFACTFGEASDQQKLSVSHRGQAFEKIVEWLRIVRI